MVTYSTIAINLYCRSALGVGGGALPYIPPQRVGVLSHFGQKTGVDFAHFCLESAGMVFKGTMGVYERIYRFISIRIRKKENYANSKWILKNFVKLLLF